MTIFFSFVFHIYQPPVQIPSVIEQIVRESYYPIVNTLQKHTSTKVTLNINGTLTEQLHDYKHDDLIDDIKNLSAKGQIEFTGSGKFHPLLPLLPEPEVIRQIKLNEETNRHYFGEYYNPKGFFPPEMAVSEEILKPIKDMGYEWIIMSGIANNLRDWPTDYVTKEPNGLNLFFRDDIISNDIAFSKIKDVDTFVNRLKYQDQKNDYYVIIALDGETFGHHLKHSVVDFLTPLFKSLPRRNDIKLCHLSEIIDKFPEGPIQIPKTSTWSTLSVDLSNGNPFPLWLDPNNEIHQEQYRFTMFALTSVHLAKKYYDFMSKDQKKLFKNARNFFDRGSHSCQQWWASRKPWYSPDMIMRGLNEMLLSAINAKRSIPFEASEIIEAMNLIIDGMLKLKTKLFYFYLDRIGKSIQLYYVIKK